MSATSAAAEQRDLTTIQSDIEQALCHVHTLLKEYHDNASSKLAPYTPKVVEGISFTHDCFGDATNSFDIRIGEISSVGGKSVGEFKSNLKFFVDKETEETKNEFLNVNTWRDEVTGKTRMLEDRATDISRYRVREDFEIFISSKCKSGKVLVERERVFEKP